MESDGFSFFRIDGTSLRYHLRGDGPLLILIHGSLDGIQSFRRQVPLFAEHFRVLRYARRFHPPSESLAKSGHYTLEIHVRDLLALLDGLGHERAHLIGSSYGAYVALGMALRAPDRVRSLVLGEPPILPFLQRTREGSVELERFIRTALEPAREAFRRGDLRAGVRYFVDGVRGMKGAFEAMPEVLQSELLRFAPELKLELTSERERFMPDIPCAALEGLSTPALLVTGEKSPRLFHLVIQELARCLKNARQVEIAGAGHAMHAMNPRAYTVEVLKFLSDIS